MKTKQLVVAALVGAVMVVGTAMPTLADKGGQPNGQSCGGIGREARTFAAAEGPMDEDALFEAQGPFTCDDVGEEHSQGQGF